MIPRVKVGGGGRRCIYDQTNDCDSLPYQTMGSAKCVRAREREREGLSVATCVCGCVCVCEREREKARMGITVYTNLM